jgi:hypothetical protein
MVLVYKMEKIFSPGWFNVMQHFLGLEDLHNSGGCIVRKKN